MTPAEADALSTLELDAWMEGRQDFNDKVLEVLSWLTANLVSVHVKPGSQPRISSIIPDVVKERTKERVAFFKDEDEEPELVQEIPGTADEARDRVRKKRDHEDAKVWWASDEGQWLKELLESESESGQEKKGEEAVDEDFPFPENA